MTTNVRFILLNPLFARWTCCKTQCPRVPVMSHLRLCETCVWSNEDNSSGYISFTTRL